MNQKTYLEEFVIEELAAPTIIEGQKYSIREVLVKLTQLVRELISLVQIKASLVALSL